MAFKKQDALHVKENVWYRYLGVYEVPCNVYFASGVEFSELNTKEHFEALVDSLKKAATENRAPCACFSVTQKEKGWKIVQEYINQHPNKFQTVTTGSRHGKYKVMWVFFKANGRQF